MSDGTKNSSRKSSRLLVGTTLVLSLLLTITVSAVIYLSMCQHNTVTQRMNATPEYMYVRHGTLQSDNSNGVCVNKQRKLSLQKKEIIFLKA